MSTVEKAHGTDSDGEYQQNGPHTAPLPSPEEIQAALADAYENRRPAWHYVAAGASAILLVGGVYVATKGEAKVVAGTPVAAGALPFPSALVPEGAGSPEARIRTSNICEVFLAGPKSFINDKTIPTDYKCSEWPQTEQGEPAASPLLPLATMSGKPEASATWTHRRAPIRRVEMQVTEDRSISGSSLFDNIAKEYPGDRSAALTINGYPARFISDIGNSIGRTAAEQDVSAAIVKVPTTEGSRDITIAVQWGAGFGGHNDSIAQVNQQIGNNALTSAIPLLLPEALPAN